jgi:catechol 2,3-dioxygenase-like lactoylglutathione lyase family enzyme
MKLGYVILFVPDVAATASFYEKAFGLTRRFEAESGQYIEMDTGGTALGFTSEAFVRQGGMAFASLDVKGNPPAIEIALVADDVAAAVARSAEAGAVVVKQPEIKPWGQTVAYVRDLNGVLVELCTKMA